MTPLRRYYCALCTLGMMLTVIKTAYNPITTYGTSSQHATLKRKGPHAEDLSSLETYRAVEMMTLDASGDDKR